MPDPQYRTFPFVFANRGLVARYSVDRPPPQTYLDLNNCEAKEENSLSTRFPYSILTHDGTNSLPLGASVHSLGRLKGLSQTYRYAGAGSSLFRRVGDTNGAYTSIATGLSGSRFSTVVYRPDFSSFPYLFIADQSQMLKDNGTFSPAQRWGILRPTIPASISLETYLLKVIDEFDNHAEAQFSYTNFLTRTNETIINTQLNVAVTAGTIATITPSLGTAMQNIFAGRRLSIGGVSPEVVTVIERTRTTFKAFFANAHAIADPVTGIAVQGTVAADTEAFITHTEAIDLSDISGSEVTDDDVFNLWLKISNPSNIQEVRLLFDVSTGLFDQDYFLKAVSPSFTQRLVDGLITPSEFFNEFMSDRNSGIIDTRFVGVDPALGRRDFFVDLIESNPDLLRGIQIRPGELRPGLNFWNRIQVKRGDFLQVGRAGEPGFDWEDVKAFRIVLKTKNTGSITAQLDSLYLFGTDGPDVFAGVPYDYRYTYFNRNTGAESSPSLTLIEDNFVSPSRQPVRIGFTVSTDSQVTHVRIYRRGGTIAGNYRLVAEVPNSGGSYVDRLPDRIAANNKILELDNDPPVSSLLKQPVDTTLGTAVTAGSSQTVTPASMVDIFPNQFVRVDEGEDEETVIVQSTTGTQFTAFFQRAHASSARVRADSREARPLRLAAIHAERAWFAGDPDNPHILYYSKVQRPEAVPPQNKVEVGTPKDPIMALVPLQGQLFVLTLSTIYRVLSFGSATPIPRITGATHGLFANFGWTIAEGEIWYVSYDGLYSFAGGQSQYMSEAVEWIFTEQGGSGTKPVVPMDRTFIADTVMEYDQNEIFVAYTDTAGARRRVIWHTTYKRYRNDDVPAQSMLFEDDTFSLAFGHSNGNVYLDRQVGGAEDTVGFAAGVAIVSPITVNLVVPSLDQDLPKNEKIYNECTLDIDTTNLPLTVELLFDDGASVLSVGPVTANGRKQVQLNINAGVGRKSKNVGLRLRGTALMTVFQWHVRAHVEAENRKSWDTYWSKYGTDEFKVMKQVWFEYESSGDDITVQLFLDGSTVAFHTITLPRSDRRTTIRVRLPARKAKTYRWIGTATSDFKLYDESHVELKRVSNDKGYERVKLAA